MKHPLWLVNSILLFILMLVLGVILLLRPKKLIFDSFIPEEAELKPLKLTIPKIDLALIYSNDLFDTYQAPVAPTEPEDVALALPRPPQIKPPQPAIKPTPKLLEPLQVSLNGIMITGNNATNIAVIKNTKTSKSKNYKVGDKIEDAQLIRIMKNKIIIIRSNGQQETLYVSQHDAQLDQLVSPLRDWSTVVIKKDDNSYTLDPNAFGLKVRNLAEFIDVLNLTTVYKQGKSVGCRIGRIPSNSLATALGLQTGDIVTTVNDIPATDTDNRYSIYQKVTGLQLGDTITVSIQRSTLDHTITYMLKELDITDKQTPKETLSQLVYPDKTMADVEAEKQRIMRERYRFAPTANQLERQQKRTMLQQPRRKASRKRNVLTR